MGEDTTLRVDKKTSRKLKHLSHDLHIDSKKDLLKKIADKCQIKNNKMKCEIEREVLEDD